MKGLGEGGAIAPPAAIANAVEDALRSLGVIIRRGPLSPSRVPASMYERSAASASSSSVPAKHEPGSISAKRERDVTSSRFRVRRR